MAGQRRGQSRLHRARGRARVRGLGLALTLTLTAACSGEADGPDPLGPGREQSGTSGENGGAAALVGTWRNIVVVQVPGDLQTWTTTWRFDSDGICGQTVVTESLAEGLPHTTDRACSYLTSSGEITITYVGGGSITFDFTFAGFSPDRLVLDGFEYERLS